jgi:Uma2 family endonuclease
MTTEEYCQTPETNRPSELIYGVPRVADSPLVPHQAAVFDLALALVHHVRDKGLGEIWVSPLDVILDATRHLVVQPDLFFVSKALSHIVTDRVRGAPDLVVEVLSPNPRLGTLNERLGWFAEYGVRECWLLHQLERRLEVVAFEDGAVSARTSFDMRTAIKSQVLPDFDRTLGSILRFSAV